MIHHTPTPWRIGDAGLTIFGPKTDAPVPVRIAEAVNTDRIKVGEMRANLAFATHAANCHDELVKALEACADDLRGYQVLTRDLNRRNSIEAARTILAKAKGEA